MILSVFGCTKNESDKPKTGNTGNTTQVPVPLSGRYSAEHNTDEDDSEWTVPYVDLDIDALTFRMGSSRAMSYGETGEVKIDGTKLTLIGELATFVFEIHNEKNIMLIDNGNHPYIEVNNNVVFTYSEELN